MGWARTAVFTIGRHGNGGLEMRLHEDTPFLYCESYPPDVEFRSTQLAAAHTFKSNGAYAPPAESVAGALMQLHQSQSVRHGVRVLVISEGPMPVQDLKPILQITSVGGNKSASDWFLKAIEDANELVWDSDNESSAQDQICYDSEGMVEKLTVEDGRKQESLEARRLL